MKRESDRLAMLMAVAIRAVLLLTVAALWPLSAATITVTNTNDSGPGSLRQAIADAASGDVIEFDPGVTGTITLTSGQLTINKSLTINGPGAEVLAISGNNASRVIQISTGSFNITISGLTIRDGFVSASVAEGGGINNQSTGTVTLNSCHILNNTVHGTSSSGLAARGGGINNRPGSNGRMILNNCLVQGNMTRTTTSVVISSGGGILNVSFGSQPSHLEVYNSLIIGNSASTTHTGANCWGGGLATNGNNSTLIVNSTISGNSSLDNGGGIYGGGISLNFVTITGNTASAFGGGFAGGTLTASKNSIIAGNSAPSGPDVSGTLTSQGYNLIGNTSGATITGDLTGNILDVSAGLAPLADNGGPTLTHALLPGSPALNAGSCDPAITADQRGFSRPQDGACDIGAFENQAPLALCQDVTIPADANCTAAVSVDNSSNDPDGDVVTVVQDPPGPYGIGTTPVTLTVTDDKGASSQCSATVTVLDNVAPVIACPGDISVAAAPGACEAVVNFTVTATDCDPNVTIVSTPPSGSVFALGTTVVTCTATDGSNNSASCSFNVTVTGGSGTIAGTITENGNGVSGITVNLLDGQNPLTIIDTRTTDSQGNYDFTNIPLASYQVAVEVPAGYNIDHNHVAAELTICGQTQTVNFVLTPVITNHPPVAICQNVTVAAGANCSAEASINNGSYDPDGDPFTITQDPPGPYPLGTTNVTLTITDNQGAFSQCAASVTVNDSTAPVISCPADMVVAAASGACEALVEFQVTALDNCDGALTAFCTPPSGSAFPLGTTAVTCIATDAAGNADTCIFSITVTGGSGTIAGTITENGNGVGGITVNLLDGQNPLTIIDSRTTDSQGDYDFTNIPLASYQVAVEVPAGYMVDQNFVPGELTVCGSTNTVNFVLTPINTPGSISGVVTVNGNGLAGVRIALLDTLGVPVAGFDTLFTNSQGEYLFSDVPPDTYLVRLIEPLGYTTAENPIVDTLGAGEADVVNFVLEQTVIANNSKPAVWWDVQFLLNLLNACNPEESEADLLNYIALVQQHYTPHFDIFENDVTLLDWWEKLRVWNNLTPYKRARRQLAGLLMNLVSGRVGQYSVVSADGRTAGEVLTYVSQLLTDGNPANDLTAELLAGQVNLRRTIAAGKVPPSNILYKGGEGPIHWGFGESLPEEFVLEQNYPNPFNPSTTIRFALPTASQVSLKIYNARGQLVRTLISGNYEAGVHEIRWDARNDLGETVSSGFYFCRMQAGNFVESRKMVLLR